MKNYFYIKLNERCSMQERMKIYQEYFKKEMKPIELENDGINKFIKNNNNKNTVLIVNGCCHYGRTSGEIIKLFDYVQNKKNKVLFKLICITFDFWINPIRHEERIHEIRCRMFKAENYKVLLTGPFDIKTLNDFHNFDYTPYKNNLIFDKVEYSYCTNEWYCKYNKNSKHKLLISGNTHKRHYPERYKIKNYTNKNIEIYKYNKKDLKKGSNNYCLTLNKYFACFSSSIHAKQVSGKWENIHAILLKTYEILAAGSLVVMPLSEEKYIKKIGLYNLKNCYLIDFNKNIGDQINYIFNNIELFKKIRYNGYIHAKTNLTLEKEINRVRNLIENL